MKEAIDSLLGAGFPWKDRIHFFESVDSTNTLAKTMAAEGAPHGTVLIADRQTAGRGRRGRTFFSPRGLGVYMSVILRPNAAASELMHLTCAAAVAMCDAVEKAAGFRPGIKWTNDLVYGRQKLAGILTELSLDPKTGHVEYAVVGIGINCCQGPGDFDPEIQSIAGSVSMAAGRDISRPALACAMIKALFAMDNELLQDKSAMMRQYRADCITIGRDISLVRGKDIRQGRAIGVDEEGALLVRFPDGQTEAVSSGEVSVRGMYGYI